MPKHGKMKNQKQAAPPTTTNRVITKDDAEHNRYPNSKTPGVHSDSAPIGGG